MTHADVATKLVEGLDPRVWGKACADAVLYADFDMLERMLPGIDFTVEMPQLMSDINRRMVVGTCTDGSKAVWLVGLS